MFEINYWAVIVATAAAFVMSAAWNSVMFGNAIMKLHDENWEPGGEDDRPPAWKLLIEFFRSLVVALVLAYFAVQLDIGDWVGAVQLGVLLWVGFPVVLLVGSVIWENVPWKLAAIHTGDWLVKLVLISVILGLWR